MRMMFLGGADEVGGSCVLIEIGGHRLIVDCGIRLKERGGNILPNLSQIAQVGGIEGVIVTHGHLDHCGSLPVLYQVVNVPLYMTMPTLNILRVMLQDALKVMELERLKDGEVPLYSLPEVEKVMMAAHPVPFWKRVELCNGDVSLIMYPCGHILGAASVILEGKGDGTVMVSGDISFTRQRTIEGMEAGVDFRVDVMVLESTYGGKLHADRQVEEDRLVRQAGEVVGEGGAMLVPAFALGRAQEVILILASAMEEGRLSKVPIIVDGLVRNICKVYRTYPEYVTGWLKKRIAKFGDPFFYDGGVVTAVGDPKEREKYVKLRPAIIVSSSGMLVGGPSQGYAQELAQDVKSFIAITGYQDEESPGRKLQTLAEIGKGELTLGDKVVDLNCGIGTYSLSAHADTSQLISLVRSIGCKRVALVHGDGKARDELEKAMLSCELGEIYKPGLGEEVVVKRPGKKQVALLGSEGTGASDGKELQREDLLGLAQRFLDRDGRSRTYTVQEIMKEWGYPPEHLTLEKIMRVKEFLQRETSPFMPEKKKGFIFRVRANNFKGLELSAEESGWSGRWSEQATVKKIEELFPEESGLYKRSFKAETDELVLFFYFPKIAQVCYKTQIAQLSCETKWNVSVWSRVHQQALIEEFQKILPMEWELSKPSSIYEEEEKIVVWVKRINPPVEEIAAKIIEFREKTGFDCNIFEVEAESRQLVQTQPLNINLVCSKIKKRFAGIVEYPVKISLKREAEEPYIELGFISLQVGERYKEIIDELERKVGWRIEIRPQPDQFTMKEIAKGLIPTGWGRVSEPKVFSDVQLVVVEVYNWEKERVERISQEFQSKTGYALSIKCVGTDAVDKEISQPAITKIFLDKIVIPKKLQNVQINVGKLEKLKKQLRELKSCPSPIEVKRISGGRYVLLDGLVRVMAAQQLELKEIEAYVRENDKCES
ncbi:MAG: MBL fold metallo-hydrolase [Nitrospirae bacterium]|nr:MBL fold metallo-hydrolase [Nitrospirota bacterium]